MCSVDYIIDNQDNIKKLTYLVVVC